jgi:hypothetical protein
MAHTFLLEPGRWKVEGTYYDEYRTPRQARGELAMDHFADRWQQSSQVKVADHVQPSISEQWQLDPNQVNQYGMIPWQAEHSQCGPCQGHFSILDEIILGYYQSIDERYLGSAYWQRIDAGTYEVNGSLYVEKKFFAAWSFRLSRMS